MSSAYAARSRAGLGVNPMGSDTVAPGRLDADGPLAQLYAGRRGRSTWQLASRDGVSNSVALAGADIRRPISGRMM